jgi:hypothetical protein
LSKISDTITSVEATILKAWCRTSRAPSTDTLTVDSGWNTTTGNISALTLSGGSVAESRLVGRHLRRSGVTRRITANGATSSGVTAVTCEAFDTAPTNGSGTLQDGFTQVADSELLRNQPMDRHFQMVVGTPIREPVIVAKGQARYSLPFAIEVAYHIDGDQQKASLRWAEDAEAIVNILQDDDNQPSGVTLFPAGEPSIVDTDEPEEGDPQWFIGSVPFDATFTDSSLEP